MKAQRLVHQPAGARPTTPAPANDAAPELFWVIKNGIRLSGMPGFAHIESDEHIWQLVYIVRSLGKQPKH